MPTCSQLLGVVAFCWLFAACGAQLAPVPQASTAASAPTPVPVAVASRPQSVAEQPPPEPIPQSLLCGAAADEAELAELISAQVGLGLLWLADGAGEELQADGTPAERSRRAYGRAARAVRQSLELTKCMLDARADGFTATLRQGHPALEAWLDTHLSRPADAPVLLSAGTAYFASLMASESPMDALLDVPIALTLLERATRFDAMGQSGLGLLLLGAYDCYLPKPFGGQPERGSRRLQQVGAARGSLALVSQVVDAELCMVGLQNRPRFERLLREVIEAGAESGNTGLSPFDAMARGRAGWLLTEVEEFFID